MRERKKSVRGGVRHVIKRASSTVASIRRSIIGLGVVGLGTVGLGTVVLGTAGCGQAVPDRDAESATPEWQHFSEAARTAPVRPTPQPPDRKTLAKESPRAAGASAMVDLNLTRSPNANDAEVTVAQNRFLPRQVVAVAMTFPSRALVAMASDDRGRSFQTSMIPLPPNASGMGDPWVRFDSRGVAHLALLANLGGFIRIGVTRSSDGGRSWAPIDFFTGVGDKPALIVDDHRASPFLDSVYVSWVIPLETLWLARSTNGGATYESPRVIDRVNVSAVDLAVAEDGTLVIAAQEIGDGRLLAWRSDDGGATFSRHDIGRLRARFKVGNPAECRRRPIIQMALDVDRSGGPRHGTFYLTWPDYPPGIGPGNCGDRCDPATPCAPDVFTARSTNGGRSWSTPVRVHPADITPSDQFHAANAVDPTTGTLYVSYLDSRGVADRRSTRTYLTHSTDGGRSFASPVVISTANSRSSSDFGHGDYREMVATEGQVTSVWADFRDDQQRGDIFVNQTRFGGSGAGGDPGGGCPLPPGHPRLCVDCGPCADGEGDCDGDAQCTAGTRCVDNVGAQFGFAPGIDVCMATGGSGDCALPPGHPRYCVDCGPCRDGQGDCDGDAQCVTGTACVDNIGAEFGFAPGIDICRADAGSPTACPLPPGHPAFCSQCGPCDSGQGDCDRDTECAPGLRCADNVGPSFGFGARVDVCVALP